jgi:hypothetical protein
MGNLPKTRLFGSRAVIALVKAYNFLSYGQEALDDAGHRRHFVGRLWNWHQGHNRQSQPQRSGKSNMRQLSRGILTRWGLVYPDVKSNPTFNKEVTLFGGCAALEFLVVHMLIS